METNLPANVTAYSVCGNTCHFETGVKLVKEEYIVYINFIINKDNPLHAIRLSSIIEKEHLSLYCKQIGIIDIKINEFLYKVFDKVIEFTHKDAELGYNVNEARILYLDRLGKVISATSKLLHTAIIQMEKSVDGGIAVFDVKEKVIFDNLNPN